MVLPAPAETCPERIALGLGDLRCCFPVGHHEGPARTGHYYKSAGVPQVHDTEAVES